MREEKHEVCTGKKKGFKKLKASQVSPSKDNLDKTKTVEERQPQSDVCQVLPIVDVGPDYQADGGHLEGNGNGAEALAWLLGPDCAAPTEAAELASTQPAQNSLDPEAFCLKFYQVRRKQFNLIENMAGACLLYIVKHTLMPQSLMTLPLFRYPLTTSALPKLIRATGKPSLKTLSVLLPSHCARQHNSLLVRSLLLTSLPTWQLPWWREAPGSKYLT